MENEFQGAYNEYARVVSDDDNRPIFRTEAYWDAPIGRIHESSNGLTVRSDYNYGDYSVYKPSDAIPYRIEDIISECERVYRREPLVHHMIDLMTDFSAQGIRLVCADKRQERFYQQYARFVGLSEFADKFFRTLYLSGTVVVKEIDGKIPLKVQKRWKSAAASANKLTSFNPFVTDNQIQPGKDPDGLKVDIKDDESKKALMPLKWVIHDPRAIYMVGEL